MRIAICGIPHTIKFYDDIFDTDMHMGQIDYKTAEIKLSKGMSREVTAETLCHEITHSMLVRIGRDDLSQDETFVTALSNAIYQSFDPRIEKDE
jgi:hypothetical protein